ncbi:SOS response-associated peptidase family protein [Corynebacterium propinquum]|uniref:SOS response-associated peptidase family protein n=1 Tax=Corynebacterium propinquum TaxID=43769 RepID=UPI002541AE9E|nr:SOS response-associated peptidase family protein [Corynebacterium propinquum]MDK4257774.1 SOS response-associated peptidase family protein [Corynebacterium propinquum]MDK4282460.1 SOS response-associated peptidase family protein [Corynebacterium propinquum]MDK4298605.1 SOS response-associated peptidase family protein [Corynebacterium propinquum]
MCATYGLEPTMELPNYEPLFQPESQQLLEQWMDQRAGTAKITGRKARNLNPLITAPEGKRQLDLAWWWLHLGNEPAQFSAFNARDDKLLHSRVWKKPFAQHRGLAPAHWYIEKGQRFELPDAQGFAIATIVATSQQLEGDLLSYALVTRDAVAEAATVHPRMPLLLPEELHDDWLDPNLHGDEELLAEALAASEHLSQQVRIADAPNDARAQHKPRANSAKAQPGDATLF